MGKTHWICAVVMGASAGLACAGGVPLGESRAAPLFGSREAAPLIQAALPGAEVQNGRGSLFAGTSAGGLLAPYPARIRAARLGAGTSGRFGADVAALKALIARAEAGPAGYDAVVWSARIKPGKPPTRMTLAEIDAWIEATPNQNHAIGRYQFIPRTLRWLARRAGLPPQVRFSPELQDHLAHMLLLDAGLADFRAGELTQTAFMNNLAKTWAGLPNSSGRSHYHGFAGNKATMSWAEFQSRMNAIFPSG